MGTPHKHALLIKAWADNLDTKFQLLTSAGAWTDIVGHPGWVSGCEYRVKPEPKPDVVHRGRVWRTEQGFTISGYSDNPNVRAVFDGETNQLKAISLINKD